MAAATATYALLRAFVDELARCGMRAACTSPGSRCAPLVLSLAREPRLRCYSHVDERCAGFFALGLAKASGLPVAIACTSGTAAAELLPAAIEAREARVPLLLLTADRPAELRENGAGQTVDQVKLFGSAAKWFFEVDVEGEPLTWMRTLACRAYWTTLEGRPGVVHLNFPLREPLVVETRELGEDSSGRPGGKPYVQRPVPPLRAPATTTELGDLICRARRGVLVAGRHERRDGLGRAATAFAAAAGWPLLADPMSGARRGTAAIAHYDAILRSRVFAEAMTPDLVLRVGDLPVSKPLRTWLAELNSVPQVTLDPEGAWQDPASVLSHSFMLEPAYALEELARLLSGATRPPSSLEQDWLASWCSADKRTVEAITSVLGEEELSEPHVASELGVLLPEEATLFVASSMPVRDVETFWPARPDPPRVLCNRGANGIDGVVSSAFGVAAEATGPVVLLIGDVALAHDLGGLLAARRLGLRLTIVAIDNGGGGIFDFLPVAGASVGHGDADHDGLDEAGIPGTGPPGESFYTRHIATPTGLDFAVAARLYGLAHERVGDIHTFRAALERALAHEGSSILEVRSSRAENVALHRRVWAAVGDAVEGNLMF